MKKKHIHILAYSLFGLFVLANIVFFFSGKCYACEEELIEENQIVVTVNLEVWKSKISDDVVILDIRTPQEFSSGKIGEAINIDFYSPNFESELNKLDKNKTYLVYCRSGNRAGQSLPIFKKLEFKEVYNLQGGINVWK